MGQAKLSIRIDEDVKEKAEQVLDELGMTTSAAVTVYMKQIIKTGGIPFPITTRPADPLYSGAYQRRLQESLEQLEQGDVVVKTMEELEAMAADD